MSHDLVNATTMVRHIVLEVCCANDMLSQRQTERVTDSAKPFIALNAEVGR